MPSDYYIANFNGTLVQKLALLDKIAQAYPGFQEHLNRGQRRALAGSTTGDIALRRMPDIRPSNDHGQIIWKQASGTPSAVAGATQFNHASIRAHIAANHDDWSVGEQLVDPT